MSYFSEKLRGASHGVARSLIERLETRQLLSSSLSPSLSSPTPSNFAQTLQFAKNSAASVSTAKLDYLPGQIATISGRGFKSGEQVRLQVLHIDGTPNTAPEHRPWLIIAGTTGTFHSGYFVGKDDLNTTMQLTAVGLSSGRTAKEIFKDGLITTTTTLAASASPTAFGQSVTFTATVTKGATGTVSFYDSTSVLATASVNVSGKAVLTATTLAVGSHAMYASYGGDATHAMSKSATSSQVVNRAATTTGVTSSSGSSQSPLLTPSHVVVVMLEDRGANAIGDTANMPYYNQLASSGLAYTNSHGLNTTSQEGEMNYLALYSGSTQGVTDNGNHGMFSGYNIAQSLANKGLSFAGYSESLPYAGDTTDNRASAPGNPAYDDLYVRSYNPMAQFTNVGTGVTNASINLPFSNFPTTASGYASLPAVSFITPNTLDNTHGSNDTDPYATDPGAYNLLRQNADTWLQQNINGYLQWAKQNNSLLIITDDEADRAHNFANGFATVVNGSTNLFVPGVDTQNVTPYNIVRTLEDMYGLPQLGSSATASDLDFTSQGQLGVPSGSSGSVVGQSVTLAARVAVVSPGAGTPTGTVQFVVDGSNVGSPVALSGGSASLAYSFSTTQNHAVTAVYGVTPSFSGSTSAVLSPVVRQAATGVTLTSSTTTAAWGQLVTITATVASVAPGAGVPSGLVTFMDGAIVLGTSTVNASGQATFVTPSLSVASHPITAAYSGDSNFIASTSAMLAETITPDSTTETLVSSLNPSLVGQSVMFTATVAAAAPGGGLPTGIVTFMDGATTLGTGTLNASDQATWAGTALSGGTHSISAVYASDAHFTAGTSTKLGQVVNTATASAATAIASSLIPSVFGQPVSFTATLTPISPAVAIPTGTIQFVTDGVNFGLPIPLVNGSATSSLLHTLSVASHNVSAVYSGDSTFIGGTSPTITQVVNQDSSAVALASSANPGVSGQNVIFTATVSAALPGMGTPTGTITFMDGSTVLGTGSVNASGQATFATSTLAANTHAISAMYSGDSSFIASTSSILNQTVNALSGVGASVTTVSSSSGIAAYGQPVTFTATIAPVPPAIGTPSGTVQFLVDGINAGSPILINNGSAAILFNTLAVGSRSISAIYSGDAGFTGSTSSAFAQTIVKASTGTALTTSNGSSQLPIVQPAHIVVVIENSRAANAIGDTANMPYFNQLAGSGLVFSNSQGLNSLTQTGQMNDLALYSGSTQGVADNSNNGLFATGNLAQSLANKGFGFTGYAENMPSNGDTTDSFAAQPGNAAYDDYYIRSDNPMAQFSNVGTGMNNANVNQTFAGFPTTSVGYASLPTVSFVVPNTLHNTNGSNDTNPYATDPGAYNLLRQNADTWLKQNLDGYLQWARQNNSLLIVTDNSGDKQHNFAGGFATIINGASTLFVPGVDTTAVNPYNILRTVEDMYGLPQLGGTNATSGLDLNMQGKLSAPQPITFIATVMPVAPSTEMPTGIVTFMQGSTVLGTGTLNSSGMATFVSSAMSISSQTITAVYAGSANFAGSTSGVLTL